MDFSEYIKVKILDILSIFFQDFKLRRVPVLKQNSFLYSNIVDYGCFYLLSDTFKITEKLYYFDNETIIMNLWLKLVSDDLQNYEILVKFLIHNLSFFTMR